VGFLHVLIPIGISKILMLQVRIVLVNQVIISNRNRMYKDLAIDPNTCVSVCTMFFIVQNFHVEGGSELSSSSSGLAHVPPLEKYGQQMGVEQSTPLDFRSLPHPNSLASNCEKV